LIYCAFLDTGEELTASPSFGIKIEFYCSAGGGCSQSGMSDWAFNFFDNAPMMNDTGDIYYSSRRSLDKRSLATTAQQESVTFTGSNSIFSLEIVESSPVDDRFDSATPDDKHIICLWSSDFTGVGPSRSSEAGWSAFSTDFGASSSTDTSGDIGGESSQASSIYGLSGLMATFMVAFIALTI
jgi:hypothetical protein